MHAGGPEEGSTILVAKVESEAEPKVRERLRAVRNRSGNDGVMEAAARLDDRLAQDSAKDEIADPTGSKVIEFPGRDRFQMPAFGPIQQPGIFQGVPIKIGGENDPVPVHLQDGKEKCIIHANRGLDMEIAEHLFTSVVRVEGVGSWTRTAGGGWEMKSFLAQSMRVIEDANIRKNIGELRSIESGWKTTKDPLKQLQRFHPGTE